MRLEAFTSRLLVSVMAFHALHPNHGLSADVDEAVASFVQAHQEFASVGVCPRPENFAERAWPSYLESIMDADYYFSIEELKLMADIARVSVIFLKEHSGAYYFGGASSCNTGNVIYVKLRVGGERRVRGHFERVFPASCFVVSAAADADAAGNAGNAASSSSETDNAQPFSWNTVASQPTSEAVEEESKDAFSWNTIGSQQSAHGVKEESKDRTEKPTPGQEAGAPQTEAPTDGRSSASSSKSAESLSTDSDAESDASDYLHVQVSGQKAFTVSENRCLETARALARYLRSQPLLPPHPLDATQPWTDVDSGIELPTWHCAFSGCAEICDSERDLAKHLCLRHSATFQSLCPPQRPTDRCNFLRWYLAWYTYAIRTMERRNIPAHGVSVDRRTMNLITQEFNDDRIRSLICFCCGQIYVSWIGLELWVSILRNRSRRSVWYRDVV